MRFPLKEVMPSLAVDPGLIYGARSVGWRRENKCSNRVLVVVGSCLLSVILVLAPRPGRQRYRNEAL